MAGCPGCPAQPRNICRPPQLRGSRSVAPRAKRSRSVPPRAKGSLPSPMQPGATARLSGRNGCRSLACRQASHGPPAVPCDIYPLQQGQMPWLDFACMPPDQFSAPPARRPPGSPASRPPGSTVGPPHRFRCKALSCPPSGPPWAARSRIRPSGLGEAVGYALAGPASLVPEGPRETGSAPGKGSPQPSWRMVGGA